MNEQRSSLFLSLAATVGIGVGSGVFVAFANGFITALFSSRHYQTASQSHRFIFGIVLAYGLLFAAVSVFQIFVNMGAVAIFYPLSGLVALYIATYLRSLGGSMGTLDCGTSCVDTIVPHSAQETATRLVVRVLIAIYVLCVVLYLFRGRFRKSTPAWR